MRENNNVLVSIIIPIYNSGDFLHKCLASIQEQTFKNWEAILVNDGSTDCSGAVCNEFALKDNRFIVIHQENKGVVNARNTALEIARGEYLGFVDSDDYIEPDMLEEMVSLAIKEKKDIVWCNHKEIYQDSSTSETLFIDNDNNVNIRNLLNLSLPGYLWNKLIHKPFWDKCRIKTNEKFVVCEDTLISMQLLANNPNNGVINKVFYNYLKTNAFAATHEKKSSVIVRAEGNINQIYIFLIERKILDTFYEEFSSLALKFKIEMLHYDIDKAICYFPFAHKRFHKFKFRFLTSLFYWIGFNCKFIGKLLFKIHFRDR